MLIVGGDGRKYYWTDAPPIEYSTEDVGFRLWVVKYVQLPLEDAKPLGDPVPPDEWNSYEFRYSDNSVEGYGELNYARVPSGAVYQYQYTSEHYYTQFNNYPRPEVFLGNAVKDKTITHDSVMDQHWTYAFDNNNRTRTITNPDNGQTVYTFYPIDQLNQWKSPLIYRIDEPNGSVRKRTWAQNRPYGQSFAVNNAVNGYIQSETVTVGDASGQPAKTAVTDFVYDKNGNLRIRTDYDLVAYAGASIETGTTIKRLTETIYHVAVPLASANVDHDDAYWHPHNPAWWPDPTGARRLDAVRRRTVSPDGPTIQAATEFDYDNQYANGNVTAEKRWDSVKSPSLPALGALSSSNSQVLTRSYDANGNLQDIYEPEVRTHITYDGAGNVPTRVDYAYGTSAQRSWQYTWTTNGTAILSKQDLDNNLTTSFTYDNVGRGLTVSEAGQRKTENSYDDANRTVTTKHDLASFQDGKLQSITHYDQLGRVVLAQTSDGVPLSPANGINVATTYIQTAVGRRVVTSTPYRSTSDSTLEWTCTQYDQSGRVTSVAIFKGAAAPDDCETASNRTGITRTTFDAEWTTLLDPAGKSRKQRRDGLGRLVEVVEDPSGLNYSTLYTYNGLDDLTQVTQGAQTRTFNYSSLKRLTQAVNPESGSTDYTYYDSGDLYTRSDARNILTTMTYDPLHRIAQRTYSDGTPTATYEYYLAGTATSPNIGQLKSITSSTPSGVTPPIVYASTAYTYTALGQIVSSTQTIDGYNGSFAFQYSWWLNDAIKTMRYPSLRVVNYSVDDAGRTTKVSAGATTYADTTNITNPYSADGRLAQLKLGNGLYDTRDFEAPGTPTLYKLGTTLGGTERMRLGYTFDANQNNGNLLSHTIVIANVKAPRGRRISRTTT